MLVPIGLQTSPVTAIAGVGTRRPQPDEVQGVIVAPPRDSRVEVRVEVVTDADRRPPPLAAETAEPAEALAPASHEAALYAANLEASQAATQLGAPDLRRAAAAYSAHSEYRGYGRAGGEAREPPRYLDVRA
jgi:hypothetical protein